MLQIKFMSPSCEKWKTQNLTNDMNEVDIGSVID